jgi:hypothetical protein
MTYTLSCGLQNLIRSGLYKFATNLTPCHRGLLGRMRQSLQLLLWHGSHLLVTDNTGFLGGGGERLIVPAAFQRGGGCMPRASMARYHTLAFPASVSSPTLVSNIFLLSIAFIPRQLRCLTTFQPPMPCSPSMCHRESQHHRLH